MLITQFVNTTQGYVHTWCPSLCAYLLCSHRGYLRCNCVHAYLLHFSIWKRERNSEVWTLLNCLEIHSSARVQGLDLFSIPAPAPCPNFLALVIEKGCVQIHEINVVSHTQYIIWVHPSIVMHRKTVIIAIAMLSKVVMPSFGPIQFPLQLKPESHFLPRNICLTPLNGPLSHGLGLSSIKPEKTNGQGLKYWVWVAKGLWKKKALELFLTDNCGTKKRNPALTNGNWRKQFNEPIRTK